VPNSLAKSGKKPGLCPHALLLAEIQAIVITVMVTPIMLGMAQGLAIMSTLLDFGLKLGYY
jgi:hypothetical protein